MIESGSEKIMLDSVTNKHLYATLTPSGGAGGVSSTAGGRAAPSVTTVRLPLPVTRRTRRVTSEQPKAGLLTGYHQDDHGAQRPWWAAKTTWARA